MKEYDEVKILRNNLDKIGAPKAQGEMELTLWGRVSELVDSKDNEIKKMQAENAKLRATLAEVSMACNIELFDLDGVPTSELAEPYGLLRAFEHDIDILLGKSQDEVSAQVDADLQAICGMVAGAKPIK